MIEYPIDCGQYLVNIIKQSLELDRVLYSYQALRRLEDHGESLSEVLLELSALKATSA